jgi:hypothetical protein
MLSWIWDLLVAFFTFITGFLGLKKKSVSFADDVTSGGEENEKKDDTVTESVKEQTDTKSDS